MKTMKRICWMLFVALVGTSNIWAARSRKEAAPVPLSEGGQKLEAQYAGLLEALKGDILQALPAVDPQRKATFMAAREAEKAAEAALDAAQKNMGELKRATALVGHAKGKWIGGAEKGIAKTKAKLRKAKTEAEREALQKELVKWQKNKADGLQALKERQALLDKAKKSEPQWLAELEAARKALDQAKANTLQAMSELDLESFLSSDKLDSKLVAFETLYDGKPRNLAVFAQQGKKHEQLIDELLADVDLMVQIAVADGANGGNYGRAMQIYSDIQTVSPKAKEGVLQRLALAVSLEHAVPISQRNPKALPEGPATIDPVKRYLSYEKAYLAGELDPAFKDLSVWDYRMVVDGNEPDETLAWGREMLRNYRPDHITTDDYRWRYVAAVRTDIRYGSQYNKYDKPELQFFQNILMNGGVCGRRAFFGRFILRAFGIPTTARPQRGHAALVHWTPEGWVACLGGGWGSGWTKTRYNKDRDFLATTQARENREAFLKVKRAQWVGDAAGEKQVFGLESGDPGFWYGVSLYTQREIIAKDKREALAAVGEELGEANESDVDYAIETAPVTEADKKVHINKDGVIRIPAAACSAPTKSTKKIIFMPSVLGGKQLHYSRTGSPQAFEYTFDAPAGGTYALTARLVSPSWGQNLLVSDNGSEATEINVPLTVGMWETTKPVEIKLVKGKNVLTFSRSGDNIRGLSIHDFTLTPR